MTFKSGVSSASPAATDDLVRALDAAADRLYPLAARVVPYPVVGSTNDEALRLASLGAPEGTLVVADAQTRGRGRGGRPWHSPPAAGLYVSIVLRPDLGNEANDTGGRHWTRLITLVAGVAVAEGVRTSTGLPVDIKWPNDIMMSDGRGPKAADRRWRKIAGILAEGSAIGDALQHVVLGFGVNVASVPYQGELVAGASSLEAEAGKPIDRGTVLVEILAGFRERYRALEDGSSAHVLARWCELSPTSAGAPVRFVRNGESREGVTSGIDQNGALLVRTDAGTESVIAGEVSWL